MTQQEQEFAEPFKRISPEQARELIESGSVSVIDVREDWEYARGHIPNAKLIPLKKIISAAQEHVEGDNLVFVCEVGQRSAVAAEFAAALGKQNLYNLEGGTSAWRSLGYPVET
jgi:sulfur-carrier protein adenylyltransferase/sulfurtransferase